MRSCVFCVWLFGLMSRGSPAVPSLTESVSQCRCVPDQWEGRLLSVDREFDLLGGRSAFSDTSLYIHYDFLNKLFSLTDVGGESRALVDYKKGYRYIQQRGVCYAVPIEEEMIRMCLPDEAHFQGHFTVGADIPVDIWDFAVYSNVSMKTLVQRGSCVPLSEEVYMTTADMASVTSSLYLDVHLGIEDGAVFAAPGHCVLRQRYNARTNQKKSQPGGAPIISQLREHLNFA